MSTGIDVTLTIQDTTAHTVSVTLFKSTSGGDTGELRVLNGNSLIKSVSVQLTSQLLTPVTVSGLQSGVTYEIGYYSTTLGDYISDKVSFTTLVGGEKLLYGPVNNLAKKVDVLYGSDGGRGRLVHKLYGSVDGQTKLTYFNLGEIPRPGLVVYYTDNTQTSTATTRIITQTDLDNLGSELDLWTVTLEGESIANSNIKEVTLPTWATTVPDGFLNGCSSLDTLNIPNSVTRIGNEFLKDCTSFNQAIDMFYIEEFGTDFLSGCTSFNQPLDISKFTEIPARFLYDCEAFNQPLSTSQITSFGGLFLFSCDAFNQPLDLSSAVDIGADFLVGNRSFNQRLTIPNTVESIGRRFLYNCYSMVSPIICNAPATVAESNDYTFSTNDNTQDVYTRGVALGGTYAQEWKTKFPNRNTSPYRNVGFAPIPVLYPTTVTENDNAEFNIGYGASLWDVNGVINAGAVVLSESENNGNYIQLESKTSTGLNSYTRTNVIGNTPYDYKVVATNSSNESVESITSIVSKPGIFTVSASDVGYQTYNIFERQYTLSLPANGNVYPQTLSYRLKKASESGFGAWVSIDTYSSPSVGSKDVLIALETDSAYVIEFKSSTTVGERVITYNQPAIPEHFGPTNVGFTYNDANENVQNWLSSFDGYSGGVWFIGGQSQPRVTITNPGSTADGASLVQYEATITRPNTGYSTVIPYGDVITYTFDKESLVDNQVSGITTLMLVAEDSLQATNEFYRGGTYLSWTSPTFSATAQRLGELGALRINFEGSYSGLVIDALNNGEDLNSIQVEYRVTDYAGKVITDWTTVDSSDIQVMPNTGSTLNRNYLGTLKITNFEYTKTVVVEIRASDHFELAGIVGVPLELWSEEQKLQSVNYEIEVWDWKTNTYVADLSTLVVGDLNIDWELNDTEELNFSIDLVQFEERCKDMGVEPKEILTPYKHDIRVRRNGKYILGCQLVEANIQVPNNSPVLVNIKCTGYLNLFKDQYILDEAWSGYTYAQIARKLVQAAQKPDCLIKNPTGDIDTSYWLSPTATVSSSTASYEGDRCIMGSRSGTGWIGLATQMSVDSGEQIIIDVWVKGQSGIVCRFRERQYITQSTDQISFADIILDGNWQHVQVPYTTFWKNGYLLIEMSRTNSTSNLYIDNCYVYAQNDDYVLSNLNVPLGEDTASNVQQDTRQVNYSLQNIKDAIVDLTNMEDDNFDFDFSPDRTFNCYAQKGSEKLGVEITYPGNVENINIGRSAANLANKVYHIGSGIGDERLQVDVNNSPSRKIYGTRESIVTDSNVELEGTLLAQAIGDLYDRKDPTNLPTVTVRDGSVNPDLVQVGDYVPVNIQGDDYLGTINDIYRIVKISLSVDEDAVESMKMTFEPPVKRPEKRMIRYIRDSLTGCSTDNSKQWNEIQALVLVGNEFINVAEGATVYGNRSFSSSHGGELVTDGSTSTYANMTAVAGRDAITIDLGAEYPVDYVHVWHYYQDGRTMYGERLSVGRTLPDDVTGTADLETLLWAYESDSGYVETSTGRRSKWLQEDSVVEAERANDVHMIRYIRESYVGSSVSNAKIWNEIEARLKVDTSWLHVFSGSAKVVYSDNLTSGSDYQASTDGDTATYSSTGPLSDWGRQSITIDLGGLYPIDLVKVFHYYSDSRTIYGSHLSVGKELPGELSGIEDLGTVLWSNDDSSGVVATTVGRQSSSIQALSGNVEVNEPRMVRYIKDTYIKNSLNTSKTWTSVEVYMIDPDTGFMRDLAAGLMPTYTMTVSNPQGATDHIPSTYASTGAVEGSQSMVIDLGAEYPVDYIAVVHNGDARRSYGRLSVGAELTSGNEPLETIIWNDDEDGSGYVEGGRRRWSGWIQGNPKREFHVGTNHPIRYIRDCISGNSTNGSDHWTEVQAYVYVNEEWQNVALGKTVTASKASSETGHSDPQKVTDGNIDSAQYFGINANNQPEAVTIDLGQEYYIDWIRVRHWWDDGRTYNSPVLSVGRTLPENDDGRQALEWVLNDQTYEERSGGFITKWVQGEL